MENKSKFWQRGRSILALSTFALSPLVLATSLANAANIETVPVVGGVFNSAQVFKNHVVSSITYSTRFSRDAALFTIAGVTLDTYILTLPLDVKTKARVMAQLSDPTYSIPLGYFLYSYYDRYAGLSSDDVFKAYLKTRYDESTLANFEHSLFQLSDSSELETDQSLHAESDSRHHQGLKVDDQFIASMVVIYDALVQIGQWQKLDTLPDSYTYLTNSRNDLKIINTIQPIIIDLLAQAELGMGEGDMKAAVKAVLQDALPENAGKVNNKAQALTVTLIDFVRLNVLKAYRQFIYQQEREEALNNWMQQAFDDDPTQLTDFLESQQKRRFAVQVTVDGLQQGLVEGLVDPSSPFISEAYKAHQQRTDVKPVKEPTIEPEHQQQVKFMQRLAEQSYQDPNYLPFFKRLYTDYRDSIVQVGVSSTPTISVRNLPIIKTGAKVSGDKGTGIPNFHFVDREQDRAYYFFGNDALQLDRLMADNQVKTMFDRLDYLKTLNCNAQYDWNAHTTYDGLVNLGLGESQRDYGEKRCVRELQERSKVEIQLRRGRTELLEDIQAYESISTFDFYTKLTMKWKVEQSIKRLAQQDGKGMPDFTLIYNPWPDHFAHFTGPFSDEVIMPTGELNRLDYWLSEIEKTYQEAGIYDQTLWGMAGDHGLTPVFYALNPEKVVFDELAQDLGYDLNIMKISSDEGEGPKFTNALNYPSSKQHDVIVASTAGGNFMLDFFNSQEGWKVQPTYQELTQWQAANTPNGESIDIVNEVAQRLSETLDYMVIREQPCDLNRCKVRLVATRNGKRVDEFITRIGDKRYYHAQENEPAQVPRLLGIQQLNPYIPAPSKEAFHHYAQLVDQCLYRAKESDVTTWCNQQQWRELTRFSIKPDSVNQLAAIYEESRAGTINLFPKSGIGFNTKVPGRHAGEDYLEKDAFLGFWGKPIGKKATPLSIEENGSLAPTLYEYLTGEPIVVGEDGWGFPSLLNKLDIQ